MRENTNKDSFVDDEMKMCHWVVKPKRKNKKKKVLSSLVYPLELPDSESPETGKHHQLSRSSIPLSPTRSAISFFFASLFFYFKLTYLFSTASHK